MKTIDCCDALISALKSLEAQALDLRGALHDERPPQELEALLKSRHGTITQLTSTMQKLQASPPVDATLASQLSSCAQRLRQILEVDHEATVTLTSRRQAIVEERGQLDRARRTANRFNPGRTRPSHGVLDLRR